MGICLFQLFSIFSLLIFTLVHQYTSIWLDSSYLSLWDILMCTPRFTYFPCPYSYDELFNELFCETIGLKNSWRINPICSQCTLFYPLKTSENRKVFWCFQRTEKGCTVNKLIKPYFLVGPMPCVLTIANFQHATRRIWASVEPDFIIFGGHRRSSKIYFTVSHNYLIVHPEP